MIIHRSCGIKIYCTLKITYNKSIAKSIDADGVSGITQGAPHGLSPAIAAIGIEFGDEYITQTYSAMIIHSSCGIKIYGTIKKTYHKSIAKSIGTDGVSSITRGSPHGFSPAITAIGIELGDENIIQTCSAMIIHSSCGIKIYCTIKKTYHKNIARSIGTDGVGYIIRNIPHGISPAITHCLRLHRQQ